MSEKILFDHRSAIRLDIERPPGALVEAARALSSATLHEAAGRIGALPSGLKPVDREMILCGPAVTVQVPGGDNLWLHRAIYAAQPGDVLVAHVGQDVDFGYWGEIMTAAAQQRGLAGLVLNGCVRDARLLREVGWPIFALGLSIKGTVKDASTPGAINATIRIGDINIKPGDLVFGDEDGLVVIPMKRIAEVVEASRAREAKEASMIQAINEGVSTLALLGFE